MTYRTHLSTSEVRRVTSNGMIHLNKLNKSKMYLKTYNTFNVFKIVLE